jgi:hypothetical protein
LTYTAVVWKKLLVMNSLPFKGRERVGMVFSHIRQARHPPPDCPLATLSPLKGEENKGFLVWRRYYEREGTSTIKISRLGRLMI